MQSPSDDTVTNESRLPEINGDRCVHAHIETATCQACVSACPQNAWILNDESLGLDTSACDGCGLCVPACTEGAILQTQDCTFREENDHRVLLLGCEYNGLEASNCQCIHALSYNDLLRLYQDGIKQIYTAVGNCQQCSRGQNESLLQRVNQLNEFLGHRLKQPIKYKEIPADLWQTLWRSPEKAAPGPEMSRRMFFRSALKQTVDIVLYQSTFGDSEEFKPLGEIMPLQEADNESFYPAYPHIDAANCTACSACVRACPHDVLSLQQQDGHCSYQINARSCTACNICVDICEENAIEVQRWTVQRTTNFVPLDTQKCHSCGAIFYYPSQDSSEKQRCNICSKVDHQKNLFQVM